VADLNTDSGLALVNDLETRAHGS